ncbi:MAG: hypothetical protein NWE75_04475 [Candidatus Bathyarchaeota archaeon]|nr:hypothetical protein [Candidatus Bathyarchaeota archaeon]
MEIIAAPTFPMIALRAKSRDERDLCFGPMRTIRDLWLIVGLLIILWGVQQLLDINLYKVWAVVLIVVGLYIVYRVLSGGRHW